MMNTLYQYNSYEQPKLDDDDALFLFGMASLLGRCKVSLFVHMFLSKEPRLSISKKTLGISLLGMSMEVSN